MICPHCNIAIHDNFESIHEVYNKPWQGLYISKIEYFLHQMICPSCDMPILKMQIVKAMLDSNRDVFFAPVQEYLIYPKYNKAVCPKEVPDEYKKDFLEAQAIREISPKSSAALCRRILQQLLRKEARVSPSNLNNEIDEFLKRNGLPSHITDDLHSLRKIGNFAAHPKEDIAGHILDVDQDEVEWCLNIISSLFDYFLIAPAAAANRRKSLESKLQKDIKAVS